MKRGQKSNIDRISLSIILKVMSSFTRKLIHFYTIDKIMPIEPWTDHDFDLIVFGQFSHDSTKKPWTGCLASSIFKTSVEMNEFTKESHHTHKVLKSWRISQMTQSTPMLFWKPEKNTQETFMQIQAKQRSAKEFSSHTHASPPTSSKIWNYIPMLDGTSKLEFEEKIERADEKRRMETWGQWNDEKRRRGWLL